MSSFHHIGGVHLTFESKFSKEYHELQAQWGEVVCFFPSLPPAVALFNSIAVSLISSRVVFPITVKTPP